MFVWRRTLSSLSRSICTATRRLQHIDNTLTGRFNRHIIELNRQRESADSSRLCDAVRQLNEGAATTTKLVARLDRRCCRQIPTLTHHEVLDILVAWLATLPARYHRLDTYEPAVRRLCSSYGSSQPPGDFLTICHLLGAGKKRPPSPELLDALVRRHLNKYADRLSTVELAIVATAAFRAAIRLQPNHGQLFERAIVRMDDAMDFAVLVTFVKTLRLARIRSEPVRRQLGDWMQAGRLDGSSLEFRGLAHLFVFYADNRFADGEAVRWLSARAMRSVREDYARFRGLRSPIDMRAKDFAMVLWSWAHLGPTIARVDADDLRRIEQILVEKLQTGEYDRDFDGLVDATLSLWQCGFRSPELVRTVFAESSAIEVPRATVRRVKLESRTNLLLACVRLEQSDWLPAHLQQQHNVYDPARPARDYLLHKTPNLRHVHELLQSNAIAAALVQPVRDLNIPGALLPPSSAEEPLMFVAVAEEHTTLDDRRTPFGLLRLKMRLLAAAGGRVLLVNPMRQSDELILREIETFRTQRT